MNRCAAATKRSPGFTLIEMLIVLLIMGLLVGLVSVIARPNDRGLLRVEAERLAQLLDLAVMESRMTGQSMAWTAHQSGYGFWRMTGDAEWSEARDSDLLRARTLPGGMLISGFETENALAGGAMRLEFPPYGLTHVFAVEMSLGAARCVVVASPIGEVRVATDDGRSSC